MKAAHIIAASLAFGAQPYRDDWLDMFPCIKIKQRIKPIQSDEDKTYYLNKAEQKRNRKNMKRMVKL